MISGIPVYTLLDVFFFLFGIAIGSFLNVVILRYNTGFGLDGRSMCFSCGKQLHWYELFPVLSFLVLKGKCKKCKSKISLQYPLVELFTGIAFVAVFMKTAPFIELSFTSFAYAFIVSLFILCVLIVIFVYDLRHKIIPDGLSLLLAILGFISICVSAFPLSVHIPTWANFLAGPLLFAPFALLWLVSQGRWMGLGDAKLVVGMGWVLGISGGISAVILAFWIGAVISIFLLLIQHFRLSLGLKHLTMKSEIPFAPFLIIGFALVFFFHLAVPGLTFFNF